MRKDEVRNALSFMDVATARGRRIAEGRQIDMTAEPYEVKGNAVRCQKQPEGNHEKRTRNGRVYH